MSAGLGRLRARFGVLRARRPRAADRIEDGLLGVRGYRHLVGEVRALRTRVGELERDQLLLAAHVATLTSRGASATSSTDGSPDDAAARDRARLAAIAFYEERLTRLEQRAGLRPTARHDGRGTGRMAGGRTSGEPAGEHA